MENLPQGFHSANAQLSGIGPLKAALCVSESTREGGEEREEGDGCGCAMGSGDRQPSVSRSYSESRTSPSCSPEAQVTHLASLYLLSLSICKVEMVHTLQSCSHNDIIYALYHFIIPTLDVSVKLAFQ